MVEPLWVLEYEYVSDVLERRAPHRDAHLALLGELRDAGRLVVAGAVGDPPEGGLIVLRDREAAEEVLARDPYVEHGVVVAHRIRPYAVPPGLAPAS
jgi:uncharacterized protein YciI